MNESQLLCTFSSVDKLDETAAAIQGAYKLMFNKLYVLSNVHDDQQLVLTYNVEKQYAPAMNSPISTISVHRKKQTNTIYTINAINKLIEQKNGGILDKTYKINWEELQNTVLVTAYNKLKIVHTKLYKIVEM